VLHVAAEWSAPVRVCARSGAAGAGAAVATSVDGHAHDGRAVVGVGAHARVRAVTRAAHS
jgi:hypothetical protein